MQPTLSPGILLAGRYRIVSCLGASDQGEVYVASDSRGNRECAVKLLPSALQATPAAFISFQELSRNVSATATEATVRATDFGVDTALGRSFVVSERIAFPSVAELIATRGPAPLFVWISALEAFARALDAADAVGIAHGDLKPQNLFFSLEHPGWARVSDFGMSQLRAACAPLTQSALGWAAPERAHGSAASAAADVYSLGLVTFYALTGRHYLRSMWQPNPDREAVLGELVSAHAGAREHAHTLGGALPESLDPWFARALNVDPDARFKTAGEAARALSATQLVRGSSPGVAAVVAAPLLFQELPQPEASPPPAKTRPLPQHAEGPRSSRPPAVLPRSEAREHVAGLPTTPPIAALAAASAIAVVVAAVASIAAWRLLRRGDEPRPAPSALPVLQQPSSEREAPAAPSVVASAPTKTQAHFSCIPQACEWIVCDEENVKKGVLDLELAPGRHNCSASRYGFRTAMVEFNLESGKTTNVVFELLAPKNPIAPVPNKAGAGTKATPAKKSTKPATNPKSKASDKATKTTKTSSKSASTTTKSPTSKTH